MSTIESEHPGVPSAELAAGERAYRELIAGQRWHVPERYNMAADVADHHPADRKSVV